MYVCVYIYIYIYIYIHIFRLHAYTHTHIYIYLLLLLLLLLLIIIIIVQSFDWLAGIIASHSFHRSITVNSCVSGDLFEITLSRSPYGLSPDIYIYIYIYGKAMANYPQELAQDAVCQSHTGHMTGFWFLPTRPLRLNTNE